MFESSRISGADGSRSALHPTVVHNGNESVRDSSVESSVGVSGS